MFQTVCKILFQDHYVLLHLSLLNLIYSPLLSTVILTLRNGKNYCKENLHCRMELVVNRYGWHILQKNPVWSMKNLLAQSLWMWWWHNTQDYSNNWATLWESVCSYICCPFSLTSSLQSYLRATYLVFEIFTKFGYVLGRLYVNIYKL